MIPILISLGAFAMVFGLRYIKNKENMAMIDKGIDPKLYAGRPAPYRSLKWGLLLVGAGIGLFFAYVLHEYVFHIKEGNPVMYFSLISIGGGIGLIMSYKIEKKETIDSRP